MRVTAPEVRSTDDSSPLPHSLTRTVAGVQLAAALRTPLPCGLTTTDKRYSRGLGPVFEIVRFWTSSAPLNSVALSAVGSTPITGGSTQLPARPTRASGSSGSLLGIVRVAWSVPRRTGSNVTDTVRLSPIARLKAEGSAANS